ncbi:MAG: Holliday junction branch migration protein RuvA [Rhodobacteraceae bacterium]|nr:Holliday junction branch migration protein RuvA [Paracoccaceae bacterium]MCY4196566.1 Holliday junction branch migration protein RuvA [Paracoccaceae bacterium]
MIGCLTGIVIQKNADCILLDVAGVGYQVYCSERTLSGLPGDDTVVRLFTDLQVREDWIQLFGFLTRKERELHNLLTSVQGVGAKAALAIVGSLDVDETIRAIALGDSDAIRTARGVGPKLALRIVNELKERISLLVSWAETEGEAPVTGVGFDESRVKQPAASPAAQTALSPAAEAHSALINLGYQQGEAARAIAAAGRDNPQADTAELLRLSLLLLVPK